MRFIFWMISMLFTVSVFATNEMDTIPALKMKTPFLKTQIRSIKKGLPL